MTRAVLAATFGAVLLSAVDGADAGIVFQQNFDNGGAVSDYVGTGENLFDEIAPSGPGVSLAIANNALEATRGTTNAGVMNRTTDLPLTDGAIYQMQVNFTNIASSTSPALGFSIGTGFTTGASGGAATDTPVASTFARFGISTTDGADTWRIRNADAYTPPGGSQINAGAVGASFSGPQTLFWAVNTTGEALTYVGPDGVSTAVGADAWDIWVGTTQIMNEHPALTPTQGITDFRFRVSSGTETVEFDNFMISTLPVPEPSAAALLTGLVVGLGVRQHRRR